jgi:thimet oligopeptidase
MLGASVGGAGAQQATPPALPPPAAVNYQLTVEQVKASCAQQIAAAKTSADGIAHVASGARTFQTTVLPLENIAADLNDNLMMQTLLSSVSTDRALRDASLACQNDVNDFLSALQADPTIYAALSAAQRGGTAKTAAERKLTTMWITAFVRSGAALDTKKRAAFVALNQQLNDAQTQFGANLGNDKTTITISTAQLAGLAPYFVGGLTKQGDTYTVPVNESTVSSFMDQADDAGARKAFYIAYENRGAPQNVALLEHAIALRDQLAHLLGYDTWASYVLADRMAGSPARVRSFLDDLDEKLLPRARMQLAALAALKATHLHTPSAVIDPWDVGYYDTLLRKTKYAVDDEAIRPYFPVSHVVPAVLDIYSKLLGVSFTQRAQPATWAPGVTQWAVVDSATGRYIGDFILDLFPRPGKYSHFASFTLLPNRLRADGTTRPPLDAIIGNWPKPAPGHPALLSHGDVLTFFHEFGHCMAALLTTQPYETLSSGFRWDFVEAPSQMLENWVWNPQILKQISENAVTGAPLPDDLIAKIIAARYVDDAYYATRQVMLATVDMDYHTSGPTVDTTEFYADVAKAETPLGLPPGVHPQASFGHLMSGYDAGYYGYLWSRVYAQDMFTVFQKGGLESPIVGARYRKDILEPARLEEPDVEVQAFLGRPMSPDAFYEQFGISTKTATR